MFKKFMKIILCSFILFTTITLPVKASDNLEGIIKSIDVTLPSSGKVEAGKEMQYTVEMDEEIVIYYLGLNYKVGKRQGNDMIETTKSGTTYTGTYGVFNNVNYYGDKFEILYYQLEYKFEENEEEEVKTVIYSPYTKQQLLDMEYYIDDTWKVYPFETVKYDIKEADVDTTAPVVEEITYDQNGCEIEFEFEVEETQSGLSAIELTFEHETNPNEHIYMSVEMGEEEFDGTYKYNLNENFAYEREYGKYNLIKIKTRDKVENEEEFTANLPAITITLDPDDNIFENFDESKIVLDRGLVDKHIVFRKDSGIGENWIDAYYDDGVTKMFLAPIFVDPSEVDLSTPGIYYVTKTIDYGDGLSSNVRVKVEVTDVIGEIISYNKGFEVCILYSDFAEVNVFGDGLDEYAKNYAYAKLKDGSIVNIEVIPFGLGAATYPDEEGYETHLYGCSMNYSPRYHYEGDEMTGTTLHTNYIFHLIDENHNIVDSKGNILVEKKRRPEIKYQTYNPKVHVSGIRGTLPSYTKVRAEEVKNLDKTFDHEYVAYDIDLVTDYGKVQPVKTEKVNVRIQLPNTLLEEELEVYYVDDNGKKELIATKPVIKDGYAHFEVSHFSTYAIVKKEGPNTGDKTNLPALLMMLLASFYVVRKKQ